MLVRSTTFSLSVAKIRKSRVRETNNFWHAPQQEEKCKVENSERECDIFAEAN